MLANKLVKPRRLDPLSSEIHRVHQLNLLRPPTHLPPFFSLLPLHSLDNDQQVKWTSNIRCPCWVMCLFNKFTKVLVPNATMSYDATTEKYRHELNVAALEAYLVANIPGFTAPLDVKQFKHGQSNPTYLIKDGK